MRSLVISLTAGSSLLVLSGCSHIPHQAVAADPRGGTAAPAHPAEGTRHVDEIAWFQGTLDEAFSHRGCPERHPRRTLFRL